MKVLGIILALMLAFAVATATANDLRPPYEDLGRFVTPNGLDVEKCYREMQRQDKEYCQVCREEAIQQERLLPLKNLSVGVRIFLCVVNQLTELVSNPLNADDPP